MVDRRQVELVFHGSVLLLIGLLCGFPLAAAITGPWGEDAVRGWRVAHLGLSVGAIWIYALAGVLPCFALSAKTAQLVSRVLVATIYGFAVALPVGAAGSARGLEPGGSLANWIAFLGNTVGGVGSLAATVMLLRGSYAKLRSIPV